jgi:hypothetical protein
MIASVSVVMAVFPALFAAVLILGSHVAAEALSPPRVWGSRLLGRASEPLLAAGWFLAIAALLLVSMLFGLVALFFSLLPNASG